jgi:hypothetical protein
LAWNEEVGEEAFSIQHSAKLLSGCADVGV